MFEKYFGKTENHRPWKSYISDVDSGKINIDEARKLYKDQPRMKHKSLLNSMQNVHRTEDQKSFLTWTNLDDFLLPRNVYIENAGFSAISTFAVVKDGRWYERGHMGWWACVSDEKPDEQWETEFDSMLDSLSDDTLLTIFDCHI